MDKLYTSLGFMSGTSLDGIDVALIQTDGESEITRKGGVFVPYEKEMKMRLRTAALNTQRAGEDSWPLKKGADMPGDLAELEGLLVSAHADAAQRLLDRLKVNLKEIDLVGFHGHTLLHLPARGLSVQLGDGEQLAGMLGVPVMCSLRQNDITHHGQGAPLAPIYHRAILTQLIRDKILEKGVYVFVNIGGVSNVTYLDHAAPLLACDTGPGNALIDDWVMRHSGKPYDKDGSYALAGSADMAWVEQCLRHNYFTIKPPKSIDRDMFSAYIGELEDKEMSLEDGAASLSVLTARSLAISAQYFPQEPQGWIISGGGQHNPAILKSLNEAVSGKIIRISELGINGDMIEAECFAYLAVRAKKGLPITYPGTTGVTAPQSGGVLNTP